MEDERGGDGGGFHPIKSCRTVSPGLADNRRALMAERDVATLFIESDLMDRRVVSEAQLKNRVDAFFEGLAGRKQQSAVGIQQSAFSNQQSAISVGSPSPRRLPIADC